MHLLPKRGDKREWQHTQDYWGEKDNFPAINFDDPTFIYRSQLQGLRPTFPASPPIMGWARLCARFILSNRISWLPGSLTNHNATSEWQHR
ncbi:MAG: hypothetical protein U1D69_02790, partial [Polynucleobacter sp.]|nr:hypothetical protein [Polynucleobacter sp.]